jgi:hypothetical protein
MNINKLEKLIESISNQASIDLEVGEHDRTSKYIKVLNINCKNKEIVKKCLREIEEYFLHNNYVNRLNTELMELKYYTVNKGLKTEHSISLNSYKSCPLIRLLLIREALISSLRGGCGIFPQVETGSWYELWFDNSIQLTAFFGSSAKPQQIANIEKKMENELNQRLSLSNTNYFAFRISNGVYSEPYILKISNGKIQKVICSTASHHSTALHSYLLKFIKNNNSACKITPTLPLKHNGDCTRYSDYALIQFQYLSEMHGEDKAFSLLGEKNPYEVNKKIFRNFQMLSAFCAYDPLRKRMYPLPKDIAKQIFSKAPSKSSASTPDEETSLPPISTSTAQKESENQREHQICEYIKWLHQLEKKRDELHQRYPQYSADDANNAYGAASQLVNTLNTYVQRYRDKEINLKELKECSSREIQIKRNGVLSEHRGIKEILVNFLLAIGTLGIGYAIGALFTRRLNPIRCNTDSVNLLNQGINSMHTEMP